MVRGGPVWQSEDLGELGWSCGSMEEIGFQIPRDLGSSEGAYKRSGGSILRFVGEVWEERKGVVSLAIMGSPEEGRVGLEQTSGGHDSPLRR